VRMQGGWNWEQWIQHDPATCWLLSLG
jgi:hypothetical protein